jgi:hypothetical protein
MREWDYNKREMLVYDEEQGDFRVATPQEIIYEILTLQKRVANLEAQAIERSWQNSPDRSGGQFTDDEINRDTW